MITDRRKGLALGLPAMLILSFDSLAIRLLETDVSTILAGRSLVAIPVSALLAAQASARLRPQGKILLVFALYVFCTAGAQAMFMFSILRTSALNTLTIISSAPLLAAILAAITLSERTPKHTWLAAVATLGATTLVFHESSFATSAMNVDRSGQWFALASISLASIGIVAARKFASNDLSLAILLANLLSCLWWLPQANLFNLSGWDWLRIGYGGIGVQGIAFFLIYHTSRILPPAEVGLLLLIELALAPLILWLVIDEQPSPASILAGMIVITVAVIHFWYAFAKENKSFA